MDENAVDPFVIRRITVPEILDVVSVYCKDAGNLVKEYPNFFCREHDDASEFEITIDKETPWANGTGFLRGEWIYELYVPLIWYLKCKKCGKKQSVAFQFYFSTEEWKSVKEQLQTSTLTKENMMHRKLGDYSHHKFFDGRLSFEKRTT